MSQADSAIVCLELIIMVKDIMVLVKSSNFNLNAIFIKCIYCIWLWFTQKHVVGWLSRSYSIYSNNGLQIMLIWCNLCNLNEHSSLQMSLCQLYEKWFCSKVWGFDKSYDTFWKQACFFYYSLTFDIIRFIHSNHLKIPFFCKNLLWFEK